MSYHFEATLDFENSIAETYTLIGLASDNIDNRVLFLKLSIILAVTKFQVYVENVLNEFRYKLFGKYSKNLSTYSILNSIKLSLGEGNVLIGLTKHNNFTEEKKNNIIDYLNSISYISRDDYIIDENFRFSTKFPLGKTGKKELVNLLKQIDGNENPFYDFGNEKFNNLDSVLQIRHLIIHQDRFSGTETTVKENIDFLKELVIFIDNYLSEKINSISEEM